MKNRELIRKIKFTLFSISAGLIEIISFTLLDKFTTLSYAPCYLIALILSVIWNFILNREYTFKSSGNISKAFLLVILFYLIFTPTSTLLGKYLAEDLEWNNTIVTLLNMLLNFILEYLYDRYVVFKNTIDTKKIIKKVSSNGKENYHRNI